MDAAAEVEMQRGFNELRREFLDKSRIKAVDWWLTVMTMAVAFFSLLAVVAGYVSFEKIRQNIKETKKARDDVLEEAEKARDECP